MTLFPLSDERRQSVCFFISGPVLPENKKLDVQNIGTFTFYCNSCARRQQTATSFPEDFLLFCFLGFLFCSVQFFSPLECPIWQFSIWNEICHDFFESPCHLFLLAALMIHQHFSLVSNLTKPSENTFSVYTYWTLSSVSLCMLSASCRCAMFFFLLIFFFLKDQKYHFSSAWNSCPYYECFVLLNGFVKAHFHFA